MSLHDFVREAWHIVEPATPFLDGRHIEVICAHLEAISDGRLQNVIFNVPPGHAKSTLISVMWPAWEWTQHPDYRYLFGSHGMNLSTRDSVKCRRIIQSEWYRRLWPHVLITSDQNQKTRFENTRTGYRVATATGGGGTGERARRIGVDDPHDALAIDSDTERESVLDWWDGTMSTRGNDPRTSSRVIVMQRLHDLDLTGHLIEKMVEGGEQFDLVVLPAEYEPTVHECQIGLQHDWRTEPGELLWPVMFDAEAIRKLKVSLADKASGQLQQRPAPAGGAVFKREWWETDETRYHVETPVAVDGRWLSLDTAFKDGEENDYTACLCLELLTDGRFRVREVWREKLTFPQLVPTIVSCATRWNADGKLKAVAIEDKGSGQSAVQVLRSSAPDWIARRIVATPGKHSKTYRARAASLWCAQGLVLLPHPSAEAPWLFEYEEELYKFPTAAHDDQVDALSQIVIELDAYFRRSQRARQPKPGMEAA